MTNELVDVDNHKLIYHPERVAEWRTTGDCFPIYVEIGLTNRCNHRCAFCALDYFKHHRAVDIETRVITSALEDMAKHGVKSTMFAGEGEALLHRDACSIVEYAKKAGLDVSITTNGVFMSRERSERILKHLSWLRFSLDAESKETYAKVHKTKEEDFDRVISNIKHAVEVKRAKGLNTTIGAQFLLLSENYHEAFAAASLVKEIGADNIQIKPYSHHPSSKNNFCVDYKKLYGLEESLKTLDDKHFKTAFRKGTMERLQEDARYTDCYGSPFFALIDARGNVIPCNMFYTEEEFYFGNLHEHSFSEIWTGEKRKEVLEKIKQRGVSGCRKGCRLDPINRYLHRLKNPESHDNFV